MATEGLLNQSGGPALRGVKTILPLSLNKCPLKVRLKEAWVINTRMVKSRALQT